MMRDGAHCGLLKRYVRKKTLRPFSGFFLAEIYLLFCKKYDKILFDEKEQLVLDTFVIIRLLFKSDGPGI